MPDSVHTLLQALHVGGGWLAFGLAPRGPLDPSRWQVEHLTSLLAAYTVGWYFILALYAGLQGGPKGLLVPLLGLAAIVWARRRFRYPTTDRTRVPEVLTGAA